MSIPGGHLIRGAQKWFSPRGRVIHRRVILHIFEAGVVVIDHVEGTGEHEVDSRIQFDPRWRVQQTDIGLVSASCGDLSFDVILLANRMETSILRGSLTPPGGWFSRYYGLREPSSTLRCHGRCVPPMVMLAVIKLSGRELTIPQEFPGVSLPPGALDLLRSEEMTRFKVVSGLSSII